MKLVSLLIVTLVWGSGALGCGSAPSDAPSAEEVQSTQQELAVNALTKGQASTVLRLVDDICGDTWCEGDHNFHFDRIECSRPCGKVPGTCRLELRIFPYDADLKTGPTYARSCKTSGFRGFASLVDTAPNGYQSLNWEYYDALSACINDLESQLPPLRTSGAQ
ncbi:MAG: hypothetical protein ABIQ16_25780 [Polyangiaceae bacterium]